MALHPVEGGEQLRLYRRLPDDHVEAEDVEGFDAVLHLAALSNDPLGDLNPDLTFDINWRASVHMAELAKQVEKLRGDRKAE